MKFKQITLKPRFKGNNFAGYDQMEGTHIFDNYGELYEFVDKPSYDRIEKKLDAVHELIVDTTNDFGHAKKRIRDLEAALRRLLKFSVELCEDTGVSSHYGAIEDAEELLGKEVV